jgi:hypothetical protein
MHGGVAMIRVVIQAHRVNSAYDVSRHLLTVSQTMVKVLTWTLWFKDCMANIAFRRRLLDVVQRS